MQFDSLASAWDMAGHGIFVWSAYLLSAAVLTAMVVQPLLRHRRALHLQQARLRREKQSVEG